MRLPGKAPYDNFQVPTTATAPHNKRSNTSRYSTCKTVSISLMFLSPTDVTKSVHKTIEALILRFKRLFQGTPVSHAMVMGEGGPVNASPSIVAGTWSLALCIIIIIIIIIVILLQANCLHLLVRVDVVQICSRPREGMYMYSHITGQRPPVVWRKRRLRSSSNCLTWWCSNRSCF